MKRKILAILGGILMLSGVMAAPVSAANCPTILGMRPWYDGLTDADCNEVDSNLFKGDDLKKSIWRIVLNVTSDLGIIVGVLAVGFIIYGGYMYIISEGDPGRAARGKKILTSAIIGLIISLLATVIVNFIINVLTSGGSGAMTEVDPTELVKNGFNTAYAMAGIVAVGFIIYAGADYVIAVGDPGKIAKSHKTIMYALIGLAVVILAAVITNFVLGTVGGAL